MVLITNENLDFRHNLYNDDKIVKDESEKTTQIRSHDYNKHTKYVTGNCLTFSGWDISSLNLVDAMERASVLDYNLQVQLRPYMKTLKPRPSVYFPEFIAANQEDRADNVLTGTKQELLNKIRKDIKDFKETSRVDKIIVLWTANTERYCNNIPEINGTAENLLNSIKNNESEISPSTLFAVASILEGVSCCFMDIKYTFTNY